MMRGLRGKITELAVDEEIQACFVAAQRFSSAPDCEHYEKDPREILPAAKSIVVLFAGYHPLRPSEAQPDSMYVSEYYLASHRAYTLAGKVVALLKQEGWDALQTHKLPIKTVALNCGGFLGKNGLYFHPEFGCCVNIQLVVTQAELAQEYPSTENRCMDCGLCVKKCPSGAIGKDGVDAEKCLRTHISHIVPEHLRENVYQLFGCERCQAVCPINPQGAQQRISFPLPGLLQGQPLQELQRLTGTNTARKKKIQSQAMLYAGAHGGRELAPIIRAYLDDEDERLRAHAAWALKRLDEK